MKDKDDRKFHKQKLRNMTDESTTMHHVTNTKWKTKAQKTISSNTTYEVKVIEGLPRKICMMKMFGYHNSSDKSCLPR